MGVDLNQLRYLLAVAEHGSFVRAATALHLSQPALSRSIQALERHLGAAMFERTGSGTVPTDVGRLTVERARDLVRMADELDRSAHGRRAIETGHVAAGGGPYPMETVLARAAAAFSARHPHVSLHLPVRNWDDLLRQLRSRDLDFFLGEMSTLAGEPELEIEPMPTPHPLFFFLRAGHPLARRSEVALSRILEWPVLSPSRIPPRVLQPMLASWQEAAGVLATPHPFPAMECGSVSAIKRLVETSDAISAAPIEVVAPDLESGRFVLVRSEPWFFLHYGLVRLSDRTLTQAAQRFREDVLEAEREATAEEDRLVERWQRPARRRRDPTARKSGPGADAGA